MAGGEADEVLRRYDATLRSLEGVVGVTCSFWRGRPRLRVFVDSAEHRDGVPTGVDGIDITVVVLDR